MNAIYLIIDKGKMMVKVGFTKNLQQRVYAYSTANPKAFIRDYCLTYSKTGTTLEQAARKELAKLGGQRLYSVIDGKRTEWFDFENCPKVFQMIIENGLSCLNSCRDRKYMGPYTK